MSFGKLVAFVSGVALLQVTDKGKERTRTLKNGQVMFVLSEEPGHNYRVRVPSETGSGFDCGLVYSGDVHLWANGDKINSVRDYLIKRRLSDALGEVLEDEE